MPRKCFVELEGFHVRISAAIGPRKVIEYEMKDSSQADGIPEWFSAVVFLLRDEIRDDEKIIFDSGVVKIVRKTPLERLFGKIAGAKGRLSRAVMKNE